MPSREQVMAVFLEWVAKAENDLKTAAFTLKLGAECPTDTVCFHAQQCVEKFLKAVLVREGVAFPKSHNIAQIVALLPSRLWVVLTADEQDRLTEYATVTRYPGDYEPISLAEAKRTVAIARRVRKEILAEYPIQSRDRKGALKKERK